MFTIKHPLKVLGLALAVLAASSCVDHAYDFDRLDKTVTVAGQGIAMPLGSTKQLTVGSLLEDNLGGLLTRNPDGTFSINYDTKNIKVDLSGLKDIDPVLDFGNDPDNPVEVNVWLFDKPEVDFSGYQLDDDVDISDKLDPSRVLEDRTQVIDITIVDIPKEIASLDAFTLAPGATLKLEISVPDCILTKGEITPDVNVDLSKLFDIAGIPGNVVKIDNVVLNESNGYTAECTFPLTNIVFDPAGFDFGTHSLDIRADVKVDGSYKLDKPFTSKARYGAAPVPNNLDIRVSLENAKLETISGKFDYKADSINSSFNTGNLADKLGKADAVLDFYNPEIVLDITSNVSIPASATINFTAMKKGKKLAEIKDAVIVLPQAEPGKTASKTIRISKDGDVKADIASLLRDIPDVITFSVDASSDINGKGFLQLGTDYEIDVTPKVDIPLNFGPGTKLELRDTISMPSSLAKILRNNPLRLLGDVTNTLPVQIDLGIVMTDGSYNPVTSPASQAIAAEGKSDFDITLTNTVGAAIDNLSHAIFTFKLTSPGAGKSVMSSDYLQANLSAELPKGFTLTF